MTDSPDAARLRARIGVLEARERRWREQAEYLRSGVEALAQRGYGTGGRPVIYYEDLTGLLERAAAGDPGEQAELFEDPLDPAGRSG